MTVERWSIAVPLAFTRGAITSTRRASARFGHIDAIAHHLALAWHHLAQGLNHLLEARRLAARERGNATHRRAAA